MRSLIRPATLVEAWFDHLEPDQRATARALHDALLAVAPDLARSIKWGNLVMLHRGVHALAVVAHKDHANLQVFNGSALVADFPELEGNGKGMRHLKFLYSQPPDLALAARLTRACIAQLDNRAGSPSD